LAEFAAPQETTTSDPAPEMRRRPPGLEPGFYETGTFSPKQATWPNGCHVCEVEVDPETGDVTLVRYGIADDVGTVINPLTLKGQIHGGVAQGVGQALMEQVVYEPGSGQLLTASFMEYAMPTAVTVPPLEIDHEIPMAEDAATGRIGEVAVGPPEQRLDPAQELAQAVRFREVVVGAELEADDLVDLVVTGGEHEDRHLGAGRPHAPDSVFPTALAPSAAAIPTMS